MTTIKLKNGSGAPTAGDLVAGEPALDLTNKRLYTEDSGGTVIEVGTNPTSVTTGTITGSGDLAINTDTLFVDVSADAVGIGTSSPSGGLHVKSSTDIATFESTTNGLYNTFTSTAGTFGYLGSGSQTVSGAATTDFGIQAATGNFVVAAGGNTERMRIDSSGNVGIGTSSPTVAGAAFTGLEINGNGANRGASLVLQDGNGNANLIYTGDTSSSFSISADDNLRIRTNAAERMRIDSSGNVGIGASATLGAGLGYAGNTTSAGAGKITLYDASTGGLVIDGFSAGYLPNSGIIFNNAGIERMRIHSSGNVGIGTNNPNTPIGNKSLHIKGTSGSELVLERNDTGVQANDFIGGLAFLNSDASNTPPHYSGIIARAENEFGAGRLEFFSSFEQYPSGTPDMILDRNGHVGIKASPAAWRGSQDVLQVGNGSFTNYTDIVTVLSHNTYHDGTSNKYITTGQEAYNIALSSYDNAITFSYAASGTAGNAISFNEAMRIDASGNLLVGTPTSPASNNPKAVRYGVGVQGGSLSSSVSVTANTVTNMIDTAGVVSGTTGSGMYLVSIVRDGGSYGTHFVGIFGVNSSAVTLYETLQSSGTTITVSGTVIRASLANTDTFMTNMIPLTIDN